jgi:hypothetical protein
VVCVTAQSLEPLAQLEQVVRVVPVELLLLRYSEHALTAEEVIRPVQTRVPHPDAVAADDRVRHDTDEPVTPSVDVRHAAVAQVLRVGLDVPALVRHVVGMAPAVAEAARSPAARHQLEAARRNRVLELVGARPLEEDALEQFERLGLADRSVLRVVERVELVAHRSLLAPSRERSLVRVHPHLREDYRCTSCEDAGRGRYLIPI